MDEHHSGIADHLARRGITRRQFLQFCGAMAALLALPRSEAAAIAQALEQEEPH